MSKTIWFAYDKTESGDDFQVGAWSFEPSDSVVAEVILEKYDWLIEPEYVSLPAEDACEESLIYWDVVCLDILE
ncbi:hypothetical protein AXI76_gp175 [Pseudoalteromonas phage H101]|uniref:Uncharacterized protein n=1 Tax=Pseudoalteromonas phage H101 TaxID=1654919 RepID=A0A0H4IT56_9CAUD|nr:hypothetical protein AXI76_gp175 [Pseudoalteromonas phage H101]AKO61076.1 hypothetical protein [Pseudoalteromonas phage H101]